MLLKKVVQLPLPGFGIIQQLFEQPCFVVSPIPLTPNGHKAVKAPPILPSKIKLALLSVPLAKCSSDTIEPPVNGDQESDPLIFAHCRQVVPIDNFFDFDPSYGAAVALKKH